MSLRLLAMFVFVTALPAQGTAEQPHDCEWLLRYGIYDTQEVAIDRYTVEHLRFLLSRSNAGSIQEFQKEAEAAGLNVFGLFELSLGGRRATVNFREWREAFLNTATHELLQDERLRITVKQISPVLMEAVKKCLDNPRPGTLGGWVQPSKDDLTFTLKLKYNRLDKEDAVIKSVTVVSSPAGNLSPLGEAQEKLIREGAAVSTVGEGTAVVFQRTKPTAGVTIVVNTDKGSKTLEVPAVDPNEIIIRLNRKLADLEAKVDALAQAMKKGRLQVDSFRVIFHSKDMAADDALKPASPAGGWTTYMLPPGDSPGYTHPDKYGKRVVAAWWTPVRGLYDFSKWGVIRIYGKEDQVRIEGSALNGAGRIEARIYVLYEE
jgi:hypothetical protein